MKTSAMRIRIEPELHKNFLTICRAQDLPGARVLRDFIKSYVEEHANDSQLDFFPQNQDLEEKS
jgi:hypothetical protein